MFIIILYLIYYLYFICMYIYHISISLYIYTIYRLLWKGCNCLKARQSHYEETVYFLPEVPGTLDERMR